MRIDLGGHKYGSFTKGRDVYCWYGGSSRETALFVGEISVKFIPAGFAAISCNPSWREQ